VAEPLLFVVENGALAVFSQAVLHWVNESSSLVTIDKHVKRMISVGYSALRKMASSISSGILRHLILV